MKKKDLLKLKEKSSKELIKLASDKKNEILKVVADIAAGREKNLKKARKLRRDCAQILTIAREKELIEESSTDKRSLRSKDQKADTKQKVGRKTKKKSVKFEPKSA